MTTTTKYASHRDNNMISKVRAANVELGMKPIVDVTSVDMVAGHEDMSVTKRYEVPTEEMKYIEPLKGLAQIAMRPYLRR